jgi:hypothetical protein
MVVDEIANGVDVDQASVALRRAGRAAARPVQDLAISRKESGDDVGGFAFFYFIKGVSHFMPESFPLYALGFSLYARVYNNTIAFRFRRLMASCPC